jgi:hypothetical protein
MVEDHALNPNYILIKFYPHIPFYLVFKLLIPLIYYVYSGFLIS